MSIKGTSLLLIYLVLSTGAIHAQAISIDGEILEMEWKDAEAYQLNSGVEVYIQLSESVLYVGLKGRSDGWAHVYLNSGDTIWILHASAALGSSTYVRDNNSWRNVSCYNWELRDSEINDEATARMEAYYSKNGWVSNNNAMTKTQSAEYRINLEFFNTGEIRLAAFYASSAMNPPVFPEGISDATGDQQIVFGNCPDEVTFMPDKWQVIVK